MKQEEKLQEAKRLYKTANADQKYVLESLFPELKESKDERIRQDIIWCLKHSGIKDSRPINPHVTTITKDAIAWLEKQKKQNPALSEKDEKIKEEIINYFECQSRDEPTRKDIHNKWIAWLEKQGNPDINPSEFDLRLNKLLKQFETLPKEELASSLSFYLNVVQNDGTYKQEPTNKVEPKFQNGQWIVWQNKNYKVNDNGCGYELIDQNGLSTSLEYGTIDERAHLWDVVKDAKDGDVLQLGEVTAIFKEFIGDGNCRCYCSVCDEEFEIPSQDSADNSYGCHNAVPATKEQRDTLLKAMAEAGCTFDFRKKELKKIENEIEIPFGAKDSELQEATYYIPKGFYAEIDDSKVIIKKGEKPTAWSEDDDSMLECALDMVEWYIGRNETKCRSVSDWLKSLKQRIGG